MMTGDAHVCVSVKLTITGLRGKGWLMYVCEADVMKPKMHLLANVSACGAPAAVMRCLVDGAA